MLGAIIGDIVGSIYEFDNIKIKDFPLFTCKSHFTDDTVMTIAVAEGVMNGGSITNYIKAMKKYGRLFPNAGYGVRFDRWLVSSDCKPYYSWGNGSAMRVSPIAWCHDTIEQVEAAAKITAAVTHNHPEGIRGAQATAVSIFLARKGEDKEKIRAFIETKYNYDLSRKLDYIREIYEYNESCQETVPEAIIAFLESNSFEDAIRNAISLGGDSDTLAAITGSIAEAAYGIPYEIAKEALSLLPTTLFEVYRIWENTVSPTILIASRSSWKATLIVNPKKISIDVHFTADQFAIIRRGFIPQVMEDKWFIFYEDTQLYFHRAWTGAGIYQAQIIRGADGYAIRTFFAERNKKIYRNEDDDQDKECLKYLIANVLGGHA